jgi:GT2 family glycosyltransferase
MRVSFVTTCHNRVEHTVACLESIYRQTAWDKHEFDITLMDDGSTDGTSLVVRQRFPKVNVLSGSGSLFWAGGMRQAFTRALEAHADFYVWINDDTVLMIDAIEKMLDVAMRSRTGVGDAIVVVGPTLDPATGSTSYSGWRRSGRFFPGILKKVIPSGSHAVRCDTFNANCVLISSAVAQAVGNLDEAFTHSMADFDYGLRAIRKGCAIVVAPTHVATCSANLGKDLWVDRSLTLLARWKKLLGPKGLPPREWLVFTRRHHGPFWCVFWLNPYVKFWLRALWSLARRR